VGDVVVEGNEIFGDGINVASRIQALAEPNQILVTDIVHRNLVNKEGIQSLAVGEKHLKNVIDAVTVYSVSFNADLQFEELGKLTPKKSRYPAWIFIGILFITALFFVINKYFADSSKTIPDSPIRSIAVLPFDNLTDNDDQQNLLAGMHDNLITTLSQIKSLDVISRTSTLSYKGSGKKSMQEMATELNVDAIIEASVLSIGDSVRINIQLVKAFPKEKHLWAKVFDRPFENILYLFDDVASTVANEIDLTLHSSESNSALRKINSDAYKAFMNGKIYVENNPTPENVQKALIYFNRAIELDSSFAPAYAGVSWVWITLFQLNQASGEEAIPKIYSYNQKALELDPNYPEAQYHKAINAFQSEWDWAKSEKAFRKALEVNPNHSFAHAHFAHILMIQRRWEEALAHAEIASRLDPLSPHIQGLVGIVFLHHGDIDKAYEISSRNNEIFGKLLIDENYAYLKGDLDRSLELLLLQLGQDVVKRDSVRKVYQESGYSAAIEIVAHEQEKKGGPQGVVLYERLNRIDDAIRILELLYRQHNPNLPYFFTGFLKKLEKDVRYIQLAKELKLKY